MALLPRVRDLKFADLENAALLVGEVFRDLVSWMRQQPDIDVREARIVVGEAFNVRFRFVPAVVLITAAVDSTGAQLAPDAVPKWTRNGETARVTDVFGLAAGASVTLTVVGLRGGT